MNPNQTELTMHQKQDLMYLEKRRRFRLQLFRLHRNTHNLKPITNLQTNFPNPNFQSSRIGDVFVNENLSLANILRFKKQLQGDSNQQKEKIAKEDIKILLNQMYKYGNKEEFLVCVIKISNVLLQRHKSGQLENLKKDTKFWAQVRGQLCTQKLILFLVTPFQMNRIVKNQLHCLLLLTSLLDYASFFNQNSFLVRKMMEFFFVECSRPDNLDLKLSIFANLNRVDILDNVDYLLSKTIEFCLEIVPRQPDKFDFSPMQKCSEILYKLMALLQKADFVGFKFSETFKIKPFVDLVAVLILYENYYLENNSKAFAEMCQSDAAAANCLKFAFSLVFKILELDPLLGRDIPFNALFKDYLELYEFKKLGFKVEDKAFVAMVLLINNLMKVRDIKFDFEQFYLEHGFEVHTIVKR